MKIRTTQYPGVFRQVVTRWSSLLPAAALVAACGGAEPGSGGESNESLSSSSQAVTGEDGLADGYATFKQTFVNFGFDQNFSIGYGFHPGLSTEKLTGGGEPPKGSARCRLAGC